VAISNRKIMAIKKPRSPFQSITVWQIIKAMCISTYAYIHMYFTGLTASSFSPLSLQVGCT